MSDDRAVNTVVDVAFALLFVSLAVVALSTATLSGEPDKERFDADRTATVLGTSTFGVTYSIDPVLADAAAESDSISRETQLRSQRIAHGSMAAHVSNAAVGNLAIDGKRVTATGQQYQSVIDRRLKTQLAGTQFETQVTTHWEPYPEASVSGTATVGTDPPPNTDIRVRTLRVPSGFEATREDALTAVEDGNGYAAVAGIVATAVVDRYLPVTESKHALERRDSSTMLTRYRYERLAALLSEADASRVRREIEQTNADPAAANELLLAGLTAKLEAELRNSYDSPEHAAQGLSTEYVTITVRTWDP